MKSLFSILIIVCIANFSGIVFSSHPGRVDTDLINDQPYCLYYSGTDLPECTGTSCRDVRSAWIFDFSLPNYNSLNNTCGITYLNPRESQIGELIMIDYPMLVDTFPVQNSSFIAAAQAFDGVWANYFLYYNNTFFASTYITCSVGGSIACNPTHSPFSINGFLSHPFTIVNHLAKNTTQACECYIFMKSVNVVSTDSFSNNCSFSNISLTQNPIEEVLGCYDPPPLKRTARTSVAIPIIYNNVNSDYLNCMTTSADDQDFLLVSRGIAAPSTVLISWNSDVIYQTAFTDLIFTYIVPDQVRQEGGVLNVIVTYDDMSWLTCASILTGADPCQKPNQTIFNAPWDCLSSVTKTAYILMYIAFGILAMLAIVIVTKLLVELLLVCFGCCTGIYQVKDSRAGTWVSDTYNSGRKWLVPVGVAGMANEVSAMSDTSATLISLETVAISMLMISVFLSLIVILMKIYRHKKGKAVMTEVSKTAAKTHKGMAKYSPMSMVLMMSFMIVFVSACNNNFIIQSHSSTCSSIGNDKNCSIETIIQATFQTVSSCASVYSDSINYPYGMEITMIKQGLYLATDSLYYTQMGACSGNYAENCDTSGNDNAITQCINFNSYGETCTDSNSDGTGFPVSTGDQYTRCQCQTHSQSDHCGGLVETLSKNWGYTIVIPNTQYHEVFEVSSISSIVPFYLFEVKVIDSNPRSFPCYLTPYKTICQEEGISLNLVSNVQANSFLEQSYVYNYNGSYYYTTSAQTLGIATSCALGSVQLENGKDLQNANQVVYQGYCDMVLNADGYTVNQCDPNPDNYGTKLPATVPGIGYVAFINDTNTGFSGLVATSLEESYSITLDIEVSGDFQFVVNKTSVCPVCGPVSPIMGCFSCGKPAVFSVNIFSSCQSGTVFLDCNYPILNPTLYITTVPTDYQVSFYSDVKDPKLACSVKGSTNASFKTAPTTDLSEKVISLNQNNNSTVGYQAYEDNGHSFSLTTHQHSILFIIVFIIISILLLMISIAACLFCGYCFIKLV